VPIYDAAMQYKREGVPLVIFAGGEYGNGSSRDWAAKGTNLLGVRAVIAQSYERIHRSNLVGMGVIPFVLRRRHHLGEPWPEGRRDRHHRGPGRTCKPREKKIAKVTYADGTVKDVPLVCRIDTLMSSSTSTMAASCRRFCATERNCALPRKVGTGRARTEKDHDCIRLPQGRPKHPYRGDRRPLTQGSIECDLDVSAASSYTVVRTFGVSP
jgi:hypothetical protein